MTFTDLIEQLIDAKINEALNQYNSKKMVKSSREAKEELQAAENMMDEITKGIAENLKEFVK